MPCLLMTYLPHIFAVAALRALNLQRAVRALAAMGKAERLVVTAKEVAVVTTIVMTITATAL